MRKDCHKPTYYSWRNLRNRQITYNGVTQTAADWAYQMGLTKSAIWMRITKYGWSVEKALTTPKGA